MDVHFGSKAGRQAARAYRRYRIQRFVVFAFLVTLNCCHYLQPPRTIDNPKGTWYVVSPGDSVETVAARAAVHPDDIRELNGLGGAATLSPGQLIFVIGGIGLGKSPQIPLTLPKDAPAPTERNDEPDTAGKELPKTPWQAPLAWPLSRFRITSKFGIRRGRPHEGLDLAASLGTPVMVAAPGAVIYADNRIGGYGNMVVVDHGEGLLTAYAHLHRISVKKGQALSRGDKVGLLGETGNARGAHLHFEVRRDGIPRDPLQFLPPR